LASDPVTISGSGFMPGESVQLELVIDQQRSIIAGGGRTAQVQANASGAFSISLDEIGSPGTDVFGPRTLLASGSSGSVASKAIVVVSDQELVTAVDSILLAGATVVGEPIQIWGAGFMAGEAVLFTVVAAADGGGDRILAGTEANDSARSRMTPRIHSA
jgi:hypothetical protein